MAPAGSSRVEFILTPTADGTHLHLIHTDLPEPKRDGYAAGWASYLDRLRTAARGADPGRDLFAMTMRDWKR